MTVQKWSVRIQLICLSIFLTGIAAECLSATESNNFLNTRLNRAIERLPEGSTKATLMSIRTVCQDTVGLKSIQIRMSSNSQTTIPYYYQLQQSNPNEPTVVFLPGGPGSSGIATYPYYSGGENFLNVDPIGVGCNYGSHKDFSYEQVSTQSAVNRIIEVLKKENIHRFILYGVSYGTVVATILASQLEAEGLRPEAVVLEGVLGKSIMSWKNYVIPFLNVGNRVLMQNQHDLPKLHAVMNRYQYPSEFWGWKMAAISSSYNFFKTALDVLIDETSFGHEDAVESLSREYQSYQVHHGPGFTTEPSYYLLKSILCQELTKTFMLNWPIIFKNDYLSLDEDKLNSQLNVCDSGFKLNPYDSKVFQIHAPIIYFNGTDDANTPIESAVYHYQSQAKSNGNFFYTVDGGGHILMGDTLSKCQKSIWQNLLHKSYDLRSVLLPNGNCRP